MIEYVQEVQADEAIGSLYDLEPSMHTTAVKASPEQQAAIDSILEFITNPDPEDLFYTFGGFAGTGLQGQGW